MPEGHDVRELVPHELLGPAPCDACRHASRCARTGEACLAFSEYCRGVSEGKWCLMPRQPRKDIGERLGFRLKENARAAAEASGGAGVPGIGR